MKTLTLKEAYAQAAKRPLRIHPSDGEKIVQSSQGVAVMSGMLREPIERRTNAALLCHAFNVLPSVVAALEDLEDALTHSGPCQCCQGSNDEGHDNNCRIIKARTALALANTVKIN